MIEQLDCKIHDLEAALVLVPESQWLRDNLQDCQTRIQELLC